VLCALGEVCSNSPFWSKSQTDAPRSVKKLPVDPRKIYFGWWMTIAAGLLCLWGYAYQVYGFSALFKPISEELGFSRATTSFAASMTRLEGGIWAPIAGSLADRHGPKSIVFAGISLAGLGLVLMHFVHSLWSFYLVWGVICATGINISLSMSLDVAIANWFVKKRGTAISVKWVFSGLSGVIGLLLITWMISAYGWRTTCLIGGLVLWVAGLPLVLLFIRSRRPEHYGLLPDGANPAEQNASDSLEAGRAYAASLGEQEFTLKEAMRTAPFWLLIGAYMFHGALYPVINIHGMPFLTDRGMDRMAAAAAMSVLFAASIPARFLGGFLIDRISTPNMRYALAGCFLLECSGVTLFLFNQENMVALYTFFVLYGIGMGAVMPMTPVLRARYFGRKSFGRIVGWSRVLTLPVGVAGPVLAGWIYDSTGSYEVAFELFAITLGIAVVVMLFAGPPKLPARDSLP
jgi:MFS family permease